MIVLLINSFTTVVNNIKLLCDNNISVIWYLSLDFSRSCWAPEDATITLLYPFMSSAAFFVMLPGSCLSSHERCPPTFLLSSLSEFLFQDGLCKVTWTRHVSIPTHFSFFDHFPIELYFAPLHLIHGLCSECKYITEASHFHCKDSSL